MTSARDEARDEFGIDEAGRLDDPLLMPSEVAQIFGVNPKTVTRWSRRGKLRCVRTVGGHRRFRLSAIKAAMKKEGPW